MRRRDFVTLVSGSAAGLLLPAGNAVANDKVALVTPSIAEVQGHQAAAVLPGQQEAARINSGTILMNSGGGMGYSTPKMLANLGYNSMVVGNAGLLQTFDTFAYGRLPEGSPERAWVEERIAGLRDEIHKGRAAGLTTYSGIDIIVLPKRIIDRLASNIGDGKGRVDITRPKTQELFRAQMRGVFDTFPELDGVLIRTGEVYLHGQPYHGTNTEAQEALTNGGTAILHGERSHLEILKVLRDEVCAKLGKKLIYRTWDFHENFHENRVFYASVTDQIEPHPNLVFSIKHQKGDFLCLTVFNPTLMLGKHRQIVEVQCQREVYGKGAYPFYVGQGVIEGWEEYEWMMYPTDPKGLRDIVGHPLYAGLWTWSRGGGWDGPVIKNEFWIAMNTFVMNEYAKNTRRTEPEIFANYVHTIGLQPEDGAKLREICLLSSRAVLRGQCTILGAAIDLWWNRDDKMGLPDLSDFLGKGLVERAIAEKAESVAMWAQMEAIAPTIRFPDESTHDFVVTSCTYGRLKHAVVAEAWTVILLGDVGEATGTYDKPRIRAAIERYDALWREWKQLEATQPTCSSLYHDYGFRNKPGVGAAVNKLREL